MACEIAAWWSESKLPFFSRAAEDKGPFQAMQPKTALSEVTQQQQTTKRGIYFFPRTK